MVLLRCGKIWFMFFIFYAAVALSQTGSGLLKSTLTSTGSASVVFNENGGGHFLVEQSIGQSGLIGLVQKNGFLLQQGFLSHFSFIPNNVPKPNVETVDLMVYPNPTLDDLTISFVGEINGPVKVSLFDLANRMVLSQKYDENSMITIHTSHLQEGIYLLEILNGKKRWLKKIIRKNQ